MLYSQSNLLTGSCKMEKELRKKAIQRYLNGENPKSIYQSLNRSKNWFFKWLKRYKSGDQHWYRAQSRAPKRQPTAINSAEKQRIISTRLHLESQKFAQIGPSAIKWELAKAGNHLPSDSTIKRVLKREGLIKKKRLIFPKALSIRISLSHWILITFIRPILLAPAI